METKICSSCKKKKPVFEFNKCSGKRDGLNCYCKECRKEKRKSFYERNKDKVTKGVYQYIENHKEELKQKQKLWRQNNKEKLKLYFNDNKELLRKKALEYYYNNRDEYKEKAKLYRESHKKERNKKAREKRKADPLYKFACDLKRMLHKAFKLNGYQKNKRTKEILGCSIDELRNYIESKFEPWMNWENHGVYTGKKNETWHLDHIIPMASAKTIEDVIKLNHYTNFQPLDSYINQVIKRDKIDWT